VVGQGRNHLRVGASHGDARHCPGQGVDARRGARAALGAQRKHRPAYGVGQSLGADAVPQKLQGDHHVDAVERNRGRTHEGLRAHGPRGVEGRLLAVEGDEEHAASVGPARAEGAGYVDEHRHRGGVVVGAVKHALPHRAEVVVVGAHEHPAVDLARKRRDHVGAAAFGRGLGVRVEAHRAQGVDDELPRVQTPGVPVRRPAQASEQRASTAHNYVTRLPSAGRSEL
jgi:hypothetical protein